MFKKILWMTILVLMVACTIYLFRGAQVIVQDSAAAAVIDDIAETSTDVEDKVTSVTPTGEPEQAVATLTNPNPTEPPLEVSLEPTMLPRVVTPDPAELLLEETTTIATSEANSLILPTEIPLAAATSQVTPFVAKYKLQAFSPTYLDNFVHQEAGCAWQGVAGQIFDPFGNPVKNLIVKITGTWNGAAISMVAVTGMVDGLPYGPGSYEIVLGKKAVDTTQKLNIQLFDANQNPLTQKIAFNTSANCHKNLVLINFSAK